jgi:predicted nucleic acid-binding protein
MNVVADTSPLRYLVVIERGHLLPALYERISIPPAVASELNRPGTPEIVRAWIANRPGWLEIQKPIHVLPTEVDLDDGEREAIALAMELGADLLLVDDWDARQEAARRHLRAVGTLRVLADGARLGLTNLEESFDRLRRTNFRASSKLLDSLLDEQRKAEER